MSILIDAFVRSSLVIVVGLIAIRSCGSSRPR
jgi:hypothetical protein